MLNRIAKLLAPLGRTSDFEDYYQRLLETDPQVAPTANEARSDYRQALHDAHNSLRR